ncbi:MAG: tryptophan synthase subunit alpha, partial [Vicinamibacterales bacterium]|nr:tryptophan synthase subunit alpha [Vicinamibacterales bacterium]
MTSRIEDVFARLRTDRRPGLVTYVTGGDPDLVRSADILLALDRAGADIVEVGVPFSDPLADGPVIQRASERALAAGVTLSSTLDLIEGVRSNIQAAVVLFSYANPILRMGAEVFAARAVSAGVDGVLVLDLPIEEAGAFRRTLVDVAIDPIFLLSPTTTDARIQQAAELGRGFLYGISRLGVTGARSELAAGARTLVERIRAVTPLPIAVGFGLSRFEHVQQIGEWADAAVVGSALVNV